MTVAVRPCLPEIVIAMAINFNALGVCGGDCLLMLMAGICDGVDCVGDDAFVTVWMTALVRLTGM